MRKDKDSVRRIVYLRVGEVGIRLQMIEMEEEIFFPILESPLARVGAFPSIPMLS